MDIRKISVGADYKSSSMHYVKNQKILNGSHEVSDIVLDDECYKIFISPIDEDVIYLWKSFNRNMPISIEYNINFI
jgi:hypothetical protein